MAAAYRGRSREYQPGLDGLRGVAILLVMAYHCYLFDGGAMGVDVFFVLSGFLITASLLREWDEEGGIRLRDFYVRRALRLLPAAVFCLSAVMIAERFLVAPTSRQIDGPAIAGAFGYFLNWRMIYEAKLYRPLTHFWSLCVEEHFYILWPLLLWALLRLRVRWQRLATVALAGAAAAALTRALLYRPYDPQATWRCYFGSDTRADGLLIGCALALLARHGGLRAPERMRRLLLIAALSAIFAIVATANPFWTGVGASPFLYQGGYTLFAIAVATVVREATHFSDGPLASFLEARPLVWIGKISYSLYLWHFPAYHYTTLWFARSGAALPDPRERPALMLLMNALALALACASYYLVERPSLRLKQRFTPGRNQGPRAPP